MPWKTSNGASIAHPWEAAGSDSSKWDAKDKRWVAHYTNTHQAAQTLDREVFTLRAENLRLKHENEFMLRLVNARDTPTEPPKEQP